MPATTHGRYRPGSGRRCSRSRHDASNSSARRLLVQPTLYYAQASAVLDHSITLPQGDRNARPTLARGEIGSERNLIVLDAGDVLNDGFAVRRPGINAEVEVSSRCGHGIRDARRMMTSRSVVLLRRTE